MKKVTIFSLIIMIVFACSFFSCVELKSPELEPGEMRVGDSIIDEILDDAGRGLPTEDYARLRITVLDITEEYFTVQVELQELKIGDEGIAIYIDLIDHYSKIEMIQDTTQILSPSKNNRVQIELSMEKPTIFRYYYKQPLDNDLFPRDNHIWYYGSRIRYGHPFPFWDMKPDDEPETRLIRFSFHYGSILWDEFWTFKWFVELFN